MKKTQFKDALKNVRKQIVSYLSIVLVVALGCGIFFVCRMGSMSLGNRTNAFYDECSYHDLEIRSTRGISVNDLDIVKGLKGIEDAEGFMSNDMVISTGSSRDNAHVISRTERLDVVRILEGRLPEADNECAITPELSESLSVGIGGTVRLLGYENSALHLGAEEFTVTGIMRHPNKIRYKDISTSNVIVSYTAFTPNDMAIPYTGILARIKDGGDMFSAEYAEKIRNMTKELILLGKSRTAAQDDAVIMNIVNRINDAVKEQAQSGSETGKGLDLDLGDLKISLTPAQLTLVSDFLSSVDRSETETVKSILSGFMEPGQWIVLPRTMSQSLSDARDTIQSLEKISVTFALLFVGLSVLVCYATIGKIIEEQKHLVGTTKALGFTRKEILMKYLIFGGSGTFFGSIVAIFVSFLLQLIMLNAMGETFLIGNIEPVFDIPAFLIAVVVSTLLGCVAAYLACSKLLKKPAIKLLNNEVSKSWTKPKRVEEGKKPKSLYTGLIFRNMRSDLKRVAITVASIAGCCILLLIGFSLKFSYVEITERQFGKIQEYDATVSFQADANETASAKIASIVDPIVNEKISLFQTGTILRFGDGIETAVLTATDPDELDHFCHLYDVTKGKEVRIPDGGIVIFSRLAEVYNLHIGDHISILSPKGAFHDVQISGIYSNYAGRNVYMSDTFAKELFGTAYRVNSYAVRYDAGKADTLRTELLKDESFVSLLTKDEIMQQVVLASKTMDTVILVFIAMAAIMAAVVLLNLVRIQINQKKRELTIMRINGFTVRETVNYILKENIITAVIGIVAGLVLGCAASRFILGVLDRVHIQMIRDISLPGCALSVLITLIFAAIINVIALRKIKTLKLTDLN